VLENDIAKVEQGDRLHALPSQHGHPGHGGKPHDDASDNDADHHVGGCG